MDEFEALKKIVVASIDSDKTTQDLIDEIETSSPDIDLITEARKVAEDKAEFDVKLMMAIGSISERLADVLCSELLATNIIQIIINELTEWDKETPESGEYDSKYLYITNSLIPYLQRNLNLFMGEDSFLSDVEDAIILILSACSAINTNGKLQTDTILKYELIELSNMLNENLVAVKILYNKYTAISNISEKYLGSYISLSKDSDSSISLKNNLELLCESLGLDNKLNLENPIYKSKWYKDKFGYNNNPTRLTIDEFLNSLSPGNGNYFKKILYYLIKTINLFNETNPSDKYILNLSTDFINWEQDLVQEMLDDGFFYSNDLLKSDKFGKYLIQNEAFNICKYDFSKYKTDKLNPNFISVSQVLNQINKIDMDNFIDDNKITVLKQIDGRLAISDFEIVIFEAISTNPEITLELLSINFNLANKNLRDVLFEYALLKTINALNNTGISVTFIFEGAEIQTYQSLSGMFEDKLKLILDLRVGNI